MRKRRLVLYFCWVLSLVGISFYGGAVSYGFFFGVTLIPVVSWIYLACVFFRYKVYQEIGSRNVVSGQPVPYYFVLQNDDYFAFAGIETGMHDELSYVEQGPGRREYELLPGQNYKYETSLVCRYRGEYEVGIKELAVTDFFRLFRIRYRIRDGIKAIVRPRLVRVEGLRSVGDVQVLAERESRGRGTEPDVTVRDYAPGDALKQIHWKAAARTGQLKTRERIDEEKEGVTIFFDTRRYSRRQEEYLPLENKILELVLAIGFFWAERQVSFCAFYGAESPAKSYVHGMEYFEGFYGQICEVKFGEKETASQGLEQIMGDRDLMAGRILFLVLHEVGDEVLLQIQRLKRQGCCVILYVVGSGRDQAALESKGGDFRYYFISTEDDLEEVLP